MGASTLGGANWKKRARHRSSEIQHIAVRRLSDTVVYHHYQGSTTELVKTFSGEFYTIVTLRELSSKQRDMREGVRPLMAVVVGVSLMWAPTVTVITRLSLPSSPTSPSSSHAAHSSVSMKACLSSRPPDARNVDWIRSSSLAPTCSTRSTG